MYVAVTPQPGSGPGRTEVARARASHVVQRAMRLFTDGQRLMLTTIVLDNQPCSRWTAMRTEATGVRHDPNIEKGKLVAILDVLANHFETEIDNELAQGKRLPV